MIFKLPKKLFRDFPGLSRPWLKKVLFSMIFQTVWTLYQINGTLFKDFDLVA